MSWIRPVRKMIRRMIDAALSDVHTSFPAIVVSYNAAFNTCSVQPCLKRIRTEDPENMTTVPLPVLEDVPVQQFGSGKVLFSVAPAAGSYGSVHISERSLENWIIDGGMVNASSQRRFDLSDAIFVPGLYPLKIDGDNGALPVNAAIDTDRVALRTRDGNTKISVLDNGTIELQTDGTCADYAIAFDDMKTAFDSLKSTLNSHIQNYNTHVHIGTATVSVGPVGSIAPTTTQSSVPTADMSGAKIAKIRMP